MPPVNIPTLNSLQTELNRIFLRQTNVQFSVASGGNFDYHYDTDGDKKLHYDVNLNGKGCYDCQANSELGGLVSAFFADPVRTAWRSDPSSFFAFYVNQISKEGVGGFSIPLRRDLPAIVAVEWPTPKTNGYLENLTAHEFGHILGRGAILTVSGAQIQTPSHNTKSSDYLMYPNNPNGTPCRISRDDWNIMNFVQGSAIPGTVVPNP